MMLVCRPSLSDTVCCDQKSFCNIALKVEKKVEKNTWQLNVHTNIDYEVGSLRT